MVVRIGVSSNIASVVAELRATPRRIEIATQRALLKTAQAVKEAEVKAMSSVFDRPTRFTVNSFRVKLGKEEWRNFRDANGSWHGKWATIGGSELTAEVSIKDGNWSRADNYLQAQIDGASSRKQKAFEIALRQRGMLPAHMLAVPGAGAALDAYGNMSVGQIKQILSWFDSAEPYRGSTQNMGQKGRDKKRKGTRSTRGFEYFAVQPGGRSGAGSWQHGRRQNLKPGIYKRTAFAFAGARGGKLSAIQPVLIFVSSASYRPRYPFYDIARRVVDQTFDREFAAAVARDSK